MKPVPRKLAVLISLLGLGLPWTHVAMGAEGGVAASSAPGRNSTEAAIRSALVLLEGWKPQAAILDISRADVAAAVNVNRAATTFKSPLAFDVAWGSAAPELESEAAPDHATVGAKRQISARRSWQKGLRVLRVKRGVSPGLPNARKQVLQTVVVVGKAPPVVDRQIVARAKADLVFPRPLESIKSAEIALDFRPGERAAGSDAQLSVRADDPDAASGRQEMLLSASTTLVSIPSAGDTATADRPTHISAFDLLEEFGTTPGNIAGQDVVASGPPSAIAEAEADPGVLTEAAPSATVDSVFPKVPPQALDRLAVAQQPVPPTELSEPQASAALDSVDPAAGQTLVSNHAPLHVANTLIAAEETVVGNESYADRLLQKSAAAPVTVAGSAAVEHVTASAALDEVAEALTAQRGEHLEQIEVTGDEAPGSKLTQAATPPRNTERLDALHYALLDLMMAGVDAEAVDTTPTTIAHSKKLDAVHYALVDLMMAPADSELLRTMPSAVPYGGLPATKSAPKKGPWADAGSGPTAPLATFVPDKPDAVLPSAADDALHYALLDLMIGGVDAESVDKMPSPIARSKMLDAVHYALVDRLMEPIDSGFLRGSPAVAPYGISPATRSAPPRGLRADAGSGRPSRAATLVQGMSPDDVRSNAADLRRSKREDAEIVASQNVAPGSVNGGDARQGIGTSNAAQDIEATGAAIDASTLASAMAKRAANSDRNIVSFPQRDTIIVRAMAKLDFGSVPQVSSQWVERVQAKKATRAPYGLFTKPPLVTLGNLEPGVTPTPAPSSAPLLRIADTFMAAEKAIVNVCNFAGTVEVAPSGMSATPASAQRTELVGCGEIAAPETPDSASASTPEVQLAGHDKVRLAEERGADSIDTVGIRGEAGTGPLQGHLMALSDAKLDQLRGGFETDSGLKIAFGIERAVYINGNLVTTTSLNVADLSTFSAGQAPSEGLNAASMTLVQNGPGNTFLSSQLSSSNVGTVIQNTLNNQHIQSVTVINATVNSLELFRGANLQSSLRAAVIDSLRR